MPSPFDRAISNAFTAQARVAPQAIVYRAGSISVEISDAVLGSTQYESTSDTGATVRANVTDWLIPVASLVYSSTAIEPSDGHRIEHTVDGVKRTYEAGPVGSEPCYRFSGPTRDRYRIHVREIPND
jgi:hypothetical protein